MSVEKTTPVGDRAGLGPRPALPTRADRAMSRSRADLLERVRDSPVPLTLADLTATTGLHGNTVREHLEALIDQGLVRRERREPVGRGRPAWGYLAVPAGATGTEHAGLAAALARHLHRTAADPRHDAVLAGTAWGHELARQVGPPDGSGAVAARRQVMLLLEQVGFAPETGSRATRARLTRCPLLDTAREYPDVVCGVHLGIVRGALEEYGADATRTDLVPFAEPGACHLDLLTPAARP